MEKSEKRKVLVTAHRQDETEIFEKINQRFGFLLTYMPEQLTLENAERLKGYDAVAINAGCKVDQDMARAMQAAGIRFIATRTAGKDHIDKNAIKKCGIKAANVPGYSPNAISEHTVLLILSLLRKMKTQLKRIEEQYFFLNGLRGRELKSMIVGVIGTGKIGTATIQDLSGFGCRILANGHHPNPEVQRLAEQVDLETLLEQSDIVVLHCPMSEQNYHMINAGTIQKMKPGALLVNTARGGLVDTQAVYEALQNRKLGGFAMDVYEYENLTARKDYRGKPLDDSLLSGLLAMDQVLFTTHTAFYTDQAIENIVESSLENLASFFRAGESENEI